jgi:hypothetical protein
MYCRAVDSCLSAGFYGTRICTDKQGSEAGTGVALLLRRRQQKRLEHDPCSSMVKCMWEHHEYYPEQKSD